MHGNITWQRAKAISWMFDVGASRDFDDAGRPPGWSMPMMVFGILFLALIAAVEFGLPPQWPFAIVGTLDTIATIHFLKRSRRQLCRMGLLGPTRARWWFELAALDFILAAGLCVFGVTQFGPAGALPAWQQVIADVSYDAIGALALLFFAVALAGYLIGLVQRKPIHGRSVELVNWFFWITALILIAMFAVPELPANQQWVAPTLLGLSVLILLSAAIIAYCKRRLEPRPQALSSEPRLAQRRNTT